MHCNANSPSQGQEAGKVCKWPVSDKKSIDETFPSNNTTSNQHGYRMQTVWSLKEFEESSCLLLRSHLSLSRMNKTSSPNPPGVQVSKVELKFSLDWLLSFSVVTAGKAWTGTTEKYKVFHSVLCKAINSCMFLLHYFLALSFLI